MDDPDRKQLAGELVAIAQDMVEGADQELTDELDRTTIMMKLHGRIRTNTDKS